MAISVKSAADSAAKFVQNATAASGAYGKGVANAGTKWAANTAAAAPTWALGVQQAATNGRYAGGVHAASQSKYQTRAAGVGAQRYPQGVQTAGPSWQTNTQPYLTTIANLTLAPRQPKGSVANYQRVQQVGDALRAQKLASNS